MGGCKGILNVPAALLFVQEVHSVAISQYSTYVYATLLCSLDEQKLIWKCNSRYNVLWMLLELGFKLLVLIHVGGITW